MFSDDIFLNSFSSDPFFNSFFNHGIPQSNAIRTRNDRSSRQGHSDVFTAFSQLTDRIFDSAFQSFARNSIMLPNHIYSNYSRHDSRPSANHRQQNGPISNGLSLVESNYRTNRHNVDDPVLIERSRLQWYDSNTRRPLTRQPTPPRVSGFLTVSEWDKLSISRYKVRKVLNTHNENVSNTLNQSFLSDTSTTFENVHSSDINSSCSENSSSNAFLYPESKTPKLVPIQPLQSSPNKGYPECEVCLIEYKNNDRLRHLPCGHAFHVKCIDAWLKQSITCPKCRRSVRAGLKRLERNRSNSTLTHAPVRAIAQSVKVNTTENATSHSKQSTSTTNDKNTIDLSHQESSNGSTSKKEKTKANSQKSKSSTTINSKTISSKNNKNSASRLVTTDTIKNLNSSIGKLQLETANPLPSPSTSQPSLSSSSKNKQFLKKVEVQKLKTDSRKNFNTLPNTKVLSEENKSLMARKMAAEAAIRRAKEASNQPQQD